MFNSRCMELLCLGLFLDTSSEEKPSLVSIWKAQIKIKKKKGSYSMKSREFSTTVPENIYFKCDSVLLPSK